MLDFFYISTRVKSKQGVIEILPKFVVQESEDLMIRGGYFYAVWNEKKGLWSPNEFDVCRIIDKEIDKYAKEHASEFGNYAVVKLYMRDSDSGSIDRWHKYCQKQMSDNYHPLDEQIIFSDTDSAKEMFASKRLNYALTDGEIDAYDKLISVLYSPEERHKLEWAIGAIVSGEARNIQKFMVLYGAAGSGKSTVLNIIEMLFKPYCATFDAKALGNHNASFALEPFKTNPLVAIQHDGDLSGIQDNARLNSLVSHEELMVNEKFKALYSMRFQAFLFIGTNKPVRITDAKSGLLRRLIDVSPTGDTVSKREYNKFMKQIEFELGAIASHCLRVFENSPGYYDSYTPVSMFDATNDFFNFMADNFFVFTDNDPIALSAAWTMYKEYADDANLSYPMNKRAFKEEMKNYFDNYEERGRIDGKSTRNVYSNFRKDIFDNGGEIVTNEVEENDIWIDFKNQESIFDKGASLYSAQYASRSGTPKAKWDNVKTTLSDLDTSKLHYVKLPENHIVIDFDLKDEKGEKNFETNKKEASKWPKTYGEASRSGEGIHLHYIYDGDVSVLSNSYDENIEIKIFTGNSSLRRKLSVCNDIPIAHISGGLPKKEVKESMIDGAVMRSEKSIRNLIIRNLKKQIHPATKPSVEFIKLILDQAYESDIIYDVSDLKDDILTFASHSTHNSKWCMALVKDMKFKSKTEVTPLPDEFKKGEIVFYDVESFPNLFVICFKVHGSKEVLKMINPSAEEVRRLLEFPLVGFNNRDYDNHMIWYASQGYSAKMLFEVSQNIINKGIGKNASAYSISYADVYEYSKKKQSLKKWEVELGIRHNELGLSWDEPVDESLWPKVAEYCCDDVRATEAVFDAIHGDFVVKQVLAKMAGGCVNDSTSQLTYKILFGDDKHPQKYFNYRFMGDDSEIDHVLFDDEWAAFDKDGRCIFPGYTFKKGKSEYRGEDPKEGGYVYAEPGCYVNVALLDIASMHPHSIIAEQLFGKYTKRFEDLVTGRVTLKHINQMIKQGVDDAIIEEKIEEAKRTLFDGDLSDFLSNRDDIAALPDAFKLVINKVYGLTKARFENPCRDPRNIDNIVAKRGALFMINLKHAVQERGYTVVHIKTDSIKIADADKNIIDFVCDYGEHYGYTFEHEATYEKMCLVNDAVYIAKYAEEFGGEWTATGKQFQVPYVFKSLFTHEDIEVDDYSLVFSSKDCLYLDMNYDLPDVSDAEKEHGKILKKITEVGSDVSSDPKELEGLKERANELEEVINTGHNYQFVGKVGEFCPVVDAAKGGILCIKKLGDKDGKYSAPAGTKGYRFLETATLVDSSSMDLIDEGYFIALADEAKDAIEKYVIFDSFLEKSGEDLERDILPFA